MENVKQMALKMIESMPDGCTWAQLLDRIQLYSKLEQGDAEIDAGGGIPNDQVMREAQEWLASSGRPKLAAIST